jgi:hypothetical protein
MPFTSMRATDATGDVNTSAHTAVAVAVADQR